ncbi:MAG: hypothetical protein IJQ31_11160 [Thermoguttaceae bacterium]|nr:hypothetical protein [Thermoguttaceae bacterium]
MLILLAYGLQKKKGESEMKRCWNILGWIVFGFVMAFYILITVMPDPEVQLLDVLILYVSSVAAILLVGRKWAKHSSGSGPGIGYGGTAFIEWLLRPIMLYPLELLSLDCPWNVVIYDVIFVAIWY